VERTAEDHFDPDALRYNTAYETELIGSAVGILALPLDQQIKYISNTLGWPTIKQSEWAGATPEMKQSFLMEQRFEKDLQKLMGAGGKNRVKTRDATPEDIAAYKADGIELDLLNEDGTPTKVYYTSKGNPSVTPYKTSARGNEGKNFYDKVRKDPIGEWEARTGEKLKMKKVNGDNIITIPEGPLDSDGVPETPKEIFNMSIPSQRKDFYNQLLKVSNVAGGTSQAAKDYRAQFEEALSQGTSKKTKSKGASQFNK
jgi:hypothetical protein